MTKIKICGLKRELDIEYVNRHKPEYIGFVFAESKRRVSPKEAKKLSQKLDSGIKKTGVFVNETIDNVIATAKMCSLDVIQLHGEESQEFICMLQEKNPGTEIWKAIRVKSKEELKIMENYNVTGFLLDAYIEGTYGGAGKTFDWNLAVMAKKYGKIILAGGLESSNVNEAIALVQPFAVDISSGVETEGNKDEEKIKSFIYNVRRNMY